MLPPCRPPLSLNACSYVRIYSQLDAGFSMPLTTVKQVYSTIITQGLSSGFKHSDVVHTLAAVRTSGAITICNHRLIGVLEGLEGLHV